MDIRVNSNTVVAFDLDDTLYFELDYLKSAYSEIAKQLDPKSWKILYARMFSHYRAGLDVFAALETDYNISKRSLIQTYREHRPSLRSREGATALLLAIKERGAKTAIITDGRSVTQRNKLKALQLESAMDAIVISEEIGTEKPNLKNYRTVMDLFPDKEYFFIGDNPKKDFIGARALGWKTIGILDNGMHIHKESHHYLVPDHLPDFYINSLVEINITG